MLEYQTLVQMSDTVGRMIQDTSSNRATKIKEWLNNLYVEVARKYQWPMLIRPSENLNTFSTTSPFLYLPKDVEGVLFIIPSTLNGTLAPTDIQRLIHSAGAAGTTTGQSVAFAAAGESARMRDFYSAAAEQLTVLHTASTTITAVVGGTASASPGNPASSEIQEQLSALVTTGATTVASFTDLTSFSVSELPAGTTASIIGVTSAYTYATIAAGETTARYKRVRLMQPSNTADTFTVYYKKRISKLAYDNQAIEIPVAPYLIKRSVAEMLMNQREYGAAQLRFQEAELALQDLAGAAISGMEGIQQAAPFARRFTPTINVRG